MDLKEKIESFDDYRKTVLQRQLCLILTVFKNYDHIVEFEQLSDLYVHYEKFNWEENQYETSEVMELCYHIVKNTFNSVYNYKHFTSPEYQQPAFHIERVIDVYFPQIKEYHKCYRNK